MKQFRAVVPDLRPLLEWLHTSLKKERHEILKIRQVELVVEEVFMNIVRHAYQNRGGSVELSIEKRGDGVEITFIDQGIPFDPRSYRLEKREEEGGMGIPLILRFAGDLTYRRERDKNILTVFFH
jgi:anti-sigma regulatory factor (Ser/Thr protein kinase)